MLKGATDERIEYCTIQLLKLHTLRNLRLDSIQASPIWIILIEAIIEALMELEQL